MVQNFEVRLTCGKYNAVLNLFVKTLHEQLDYTIILRLHLYNNNGNSLG